MHQRQQPIPYRQHLLRIDIVGFGEFHHDHRDQFLTEVAGVVVVDEGHGGEVGFVGEGEIAVVDVAVGVADEGEHEGLEFLLEGVGLAQVQGLLGEGGEEGAQLDGDVGWADEALAQVVDDLGELFVEEEAFRELFGDFVQAEGCVVLHVDAAVVKQTQEDLQGAADGSLHFC